MSRIATASRAACRALATLLVLVWLAPAAARDETRAESSFDCIIEPYRVLEVGSAAVGVLEEVRVDRSDPVEAGQVIAVLESGVESATVDVARLRAGIDSEVLARQVTFDLQRSNRSRTERLHAARTVAEQVREEAEHDARLSALRLRQAREEKRLAELELVRARRSLERRTIRSPVAGVVMERHKSPGERVEDHPIVRIAQLHPLRVEVVLPVERYGTIHKGMRARVKPQYGPGGELEAKVTAIDPVLDAASSTFGVRLALANPDHAVPGGLRCTLEFLPGTMAATESSVPASGLTPKPAEDRSREESHTEPDAVGEPPAASPAAPANAPPPTPVPAAQTVSDLTLADTACVALGPIDDKNRVSVLRHAFEERAFAVRVRQRREDAAVGYMVAVDAADTTGGAPAIVAALEREGISDYQPLARTPGRVSVGYFRGPRSAEVRAARMKAIGLPARIHPRTREIERYLLELTSPTGRDAEATVAKVLASQDIDTLVPHRCGSGIVTASR